MEKLRKARNKKGWSCAYVASQLGISKTYYWQLETDGRRFSYEMAIQVAKLFDAKPDELLYNDTIKKMKQKNSED